MSIKCDLCNTVYTIRCASNKALGCACNVNEEGIYGYCGSKHDESIFKWIDKNTYSRYKNARLVCDACVNKLLKDGVIYEFSGVSDDEY